MHLHLVRAEVLLPVTVKSRIRSATNVSQLVAVESRAKSTADHYQTGVKMSYKGKLLVAHPMLTDFFNRAVIYVYKDDSAGTMGLVLNKPTKYTVKALIAERALMYEGREHVYKGGPVTENAIFMLHTDEWYSQSTSQISKKLAITSDDFMMQKLAMQQHPSRWRLFAGIAAWKPGQLTQEVLSQYGWLTCDANDSIVFNKDGERQWNAALQMCANQTIDSYF